MKRFLIGLIVVLCGLVAVKPLFSGGYFPMHDDTQVERVITMGRALREGQFPVRWVSDLGYGYGYPIYNYYGPLPYYAAGFLYALGVPAIAATKVMFGIGILGAFAAMYLAVSSLAGWPAGLVAAIVYGFAPYHAVQIYVRGSVGEYWELIFWPMIIWSFLRQTKRGHRAVIGIGAVSVAGSVLSHTLLGYVTGLAVACWAGVSVAVSFLRRQEMTVPLRRLFTVLLGLGLSSFFWLPALSEMRYTSVAGQVSATADFHTHFLCPIQLWSASWGFGGSAPGCIDGMSFMLGKLHILAALFGIVVWVMAKKKDMRIMGAGIAVTLAGLFFSMSGSTALWELLPYFSFIQYPWRFLAFTGLGITLVVSAGIAVLPKLVQVPAALVLALAIMMFNTKWFTPQYTYPATDQGFESDQNIRWRASKISDEYLPASIPRPIDPERVVSATIAADGVRATVLHDMATDYAALVESTGAATIAIRRAYFPGWEYRVNDHPVTPEIRNGIPYIPVDAGQSLVRLKFKDTPVRASGNIGSLISLGFVGVLIYGGTRKKTIR